MNLPAMLCAALVVTVAIGLCVPAGPLYRTARHERPGARIPLAADPGTTVTTAGTVGPFIRIAEVSGRPPWTIAPPDPGDWTPETLAILRGDDGPPEVSHETPPPGDDGGAPAADMPAMPDAPEVPAGPVHSPPSMLEIGAQLGALDGQLSHMLIEARAILGVPA